MSLLYIQVPLIQKNTIKLNSKPENSDMKLKVFILLLNYIQSAKIQIIDQLTKENTNNFLLENQIVLNIEEIII